MLVIEEMVSVGYEINNKLNPKEYVTKIRVRFCHCLRLSGYALVIKKKKITTKTTCWVAFVVIQTVGMKVAIDNDNVEQQQQQRH